MLHNADMIQTLEISSICTKENSEAMSPMNMNINFTVKNRTPKITVVTRLIPPKGT